MTCIVLDDEELSLRHIVDNNIKKIPYLSVVGAFNNPEEALVFLQTHTVDLVFLDVEMPSYSIDGIDFMKIYPSQQRYILITAHPEYALESYEYNVVDYLRKPFSFDRFAKAVKKAQQLIQRTENTPVRPVDSLYVKSEGRIHRVEFDTIYYIEADRNYATLFRADDQIFTKKTLSGLESELPDSQFLRVHRSYIVSLDKVEFVDKEDIGIQRPDGLIRIPLSGQYKKAFILAIEAKRTR